MSNKPTQIPNNELDRKYLAETLKPTLADYYDVADKSKDGGMGEIFFCQDKRTKEFCVLKTFKTEKEDYENYFKQEAEFALSLEKHPNIVYTKTIAIEEGQNYMVMEFVGEEPKDIKDDVREKSRTLVNEINEIKEISKEQVLKWALDFCSGMSYLIGIGMKAHKDIKPSNLFITKDKTLKIGDFGITAIENKGGSPGYRAPEYFDNKAKLDIRSDIYAFGIVLHQIINGYNILNQTKLRTLNQTEVQKDENPIFPNPEAIESKYFIDIIRKCLQIRPNKRYQTIEELRGDLLTEAKKINLYIGDHKIIIMTANDFFEKGVGFEALDNREIAKKYYEEVIRLDPNNVDAYLNRGRLYFERGRLITEEKMKYYDKAIELDPTRSYAYYLRGAAKVNMNMKRKNEEGIKDLDKAIELDSVFYDAYWKRGEAKYHLKHYKDSIRDFNKAIELESSDRFYASNAYFLSQYFNSYNKIDNNEEKIQEYNNTIQILNKLIEKYSYDGMLYALRGRIKFYLKRYEDAIKDYDKAIEFLDSKYENIYIDRGDSKVALKQYAEAKKDYDMAIDISPKWARLNIYIKRGRVQYFLKDYEAAIKDYEEAIKINSKYTLEQLEDVKDEKIRQKLYAIAYCYRGLHFLEDESYIARKKIHVAIGNIKKVEAISCFDKAIELNPKYANAYYNRGLAKADLKQYEEAIKDFDEAIRLDSKNSETYNSRGKAKLNLGRYEEAIKDFDEAIRLDSKNTSAYNNRGIAKKNLGRYKEAIRDYNKAIKLDHKYVSAFYNRALAKKSLKQYTQAIADMQKYIELTTDPQKKKEAQEFIEKIKKEQGLS